MVGSAGDGTENPASELMRYRLSLSPGTSVTPPDRCGTILEPVCAVPGCLATGSPCPLSLIVLIEDARLLRCFRHHDRKPSPARAAPGLARSPSFPCEVTQIC